MRQREWSSGELSFGSDVLIPRLSRQTVIVGSVDRTVLVVVALEARLERGQHNLLGIQCAFRPVVNDKCAVPIARREPLAVGSVVGYSPNIGSTEFLAVKPDVLTILSHFVQQRR